MQKPTDRSTRRRPIAGGARAALAGWVCLFSIGCGALPAGARSAGVAGNRPPAVAEQADRDADPPDVADARAPAAHLARNDLAPGRRDLTESLRRRPHDAAPALALARLEEAAGDLRKAVAAYDVALVRDPGDRAARARRARGLYQLGEFARARDDFAACVDRTGAGLSLSEAVLFGDACLRTGDFETAQTVFDRLARTTPVPLREVELLRGLCALRRDRHAEARAILESADRRWPNDPDIAIALFQADSPPPPAPVIVARPSSGDVGRGGKIDQTARAVRATPPLVRPASPSAGSSRVESEGWRPTPGRAASRWPVIAPGPPASLDRR